MKRTPKPVFFIVALLIVALTYTTFFGVYSQYGDRTDTIIRGAKDIRFGIEQGFDFIAASFVSAAAWM